MSNPYHGETSQQNKAGGKGPARKQGDAMRGSLRMHTAPWPKPPGRTNPGWKPKHGTHARVYPTSGGM